jgi:HlyD family secretion protein
LTNLRKKGFLAALFIVILVTGGFAAWWLYFRTPPLDGFAVSNGRLETDEVDIATKFQGRIADILVEEGDKVEAGQTVALMDTKSLEAQMKEAKAGLMQAKKHYKYTLSVLEQRKSECSLAKKNLARSRELREKKIISLEKLDQDETAYEAAEALCDAAQAEVENSEASIEAAEAEIERIGTDIEESKLVSPVMGRVQYRLAEPGEVLAAGGKILTVIDLEDIYMSLFLPTEEAGKVRIGAEARIVLDYAPEYSIPARVYFVAAKAQFTPKEVETASERQKLSFRVKVRIAPEFLQRNEPWVKIGVPGVAYIRLDPDAPWPENLRHISNPIDESEEAKL